MKKETAKKSRTNGSFWKDGLSINETRFSILSTLLVVCVIYALVENTVRGEISRTVLDFLQVLLLSFVGTNAVDRMSTAYETKKVANDEYDNSWEGTDNVIQNEIRN